MSNDQNDKEMSFIEHMIELRSCILKILAAIALVLIILLPFYRSIYEIFAYPVLKNLLPGQQMLAQQPIDVFFTPVKVCIFLSIVITIPYILRQIWNFTAPALYLKEKKIMIPLIISSTILFYLGILFAYFVILPLLFSFLVKVGGQLEGVTLMPDITSYMNLSLKLFLAFGIVFEVPIATIFFIRTKVISIESLTKKRPYIILGAFVIGMLLTPPDMFSQTLLAVPMLLLFELGIFISKILEKKDLANKV